MSAPRPPVNGCGPELPAWVPAWARRAFLALIPDRVLGVDFRSSCNEHDALYWLSACRPPPLPLWAALPLVVAAAYLPDLGASPLLPALAALLVADHTGLVRIFWARRQADLQLLARLLEGVARRLADDVWEDRWLPLTRFALRLSTLPVYYLAVRALGWLAYSWRRPREVDGLTRAEVRALAAREWRLAADVGGGE